MAKWHVTKRVCLACPVDSPPVRGLGGSEWNNHIREHVGLCSVHNLLQGEDPQTRPYILTPLPDASRLSLRDCVRVCRAAGIDLEPMKCVCVCVSLSR